MIAKFNLIAGPLFAITATLYLWLAVRVSRASSQGENNAISYFLFLIGTSIAGAAFSYDAVDPNLYGIGRVLSFFSAGFLPVVLYTMYRQYTSGQPSVYTLAALSVVPLITTLLSVTNPLHHLIWTATTVEFGIRFSNADDHVWLERIFKPYTFGLFGFSLIALMARMPTIARAHRGKVALLLVCAAVPYAVSFSNNILGIGPASFPFTATSLVLLLPLYWWASIQLRVHEFSPLAYQTMFDHVRDPIIVLDKSQRIISANHPAQVLLDASEHALVGEKLWQDLPEARAVLDHARDRKLTQTVRMQSNRYYELNSAPLLGSTGQSQGTVVVCRDVTERKKVLRALADSEHLIRSLVENSSNGMLRFARDSADPDAKFRCIFANRAAELFLQNNGGSLVGMPLEKLELLQPHRLTEMLAADESGASCISYETAVDGDDGENWMRIVAEPVGNDYSVTLIDITERKHNENKILEDALRDPLTGAFNRRGFENKAVPSIAEISQGAVLYLDLDGFKAINDRFGHQAGDALLKAFGKRLEFCLRPEDILGRLGGDEFAIVLPGIGVADATHVLQRLIEATAAAYIIHGEEIVCAASVGIALLPAHGTELWQLVAMADQAMYNAKAGCRGDAADKRMANLTAALAS